MDLFNETKNRYFRAAQIMINRIHNGEAISKNEFYNSMKELTKDEVFASVNFRDKELRDGGIDIFDFGNKDSENSDNDKEKSSEDNRVKLKKDAAVPVLPCTAEKAWLKAVLADEHSRLFLDEAMRARLQDILAESELPDINMDVKRERVWADEITDDLAEKLQIVLEAIRSNRELIYSNHTPKGDYICKRAIPYKVEYAIAEDTLRVPMYSCEENRPIKAKLSRMFDLSIGDPVTDSDTLEDKIKERQESEPLVFVVKNDERNALVRAVHTFSSYTPIVVKQDKDHWRFEISYYTFDKNALISDILAFGPRIKVINPAEIRDEVIRRITGWNVLSEQENSASSQGAEKQTYNVMS